MYNKEREKLYDSGFVEVDHFVKNNIYGDFLNEKSFDFNHFRSIESINQYYDASVCFHEPGGEGYKLVLNCLQKYLDFKFIRENNCFRFDDTLFDHRVSIVSDSSVLNNNYVVSRDSNENDRTMNGSRADIYYLLNEADQTDIASRRCLSYVNSNRLHLTAVLVQLIERIVDNLEKDPLKKHQEYGRVLRAAYMTPEYAEYDVFELFSLLGCSKKQYYRLRNAGITLLSETLFGIFAGENGFANLFIRNKEIKILDRM